MTQQLETPAAPAALQARSSRIGDRVLRGLASTSGIAVLAITAAIAIFLVVKAIPSLRVDTVDFLTSTQWNPDATPAAFGVAALVFGTVLAGVLAMVMAVPVAVGVALFIAHYAPRGIASVLGYVVDLLAAVPSVIYGLWGIYYLAPRLVPVEQFLNQHFGWIPLFAGTVTNARTMFTASVILAIMILPIVAAVSREVFLQVPRSHIEAALALGATRWEAIRMSVLPFGRPGVVSAAMLGLGRRSARRSRSPSCCRPPTRSPSRSSSPAATPSPPTSPTPSPSPARSASAPSSPAVSCCSSSPWP